MPTLDLGVLVSGNGTNLKALLEAIDEGRLDARVRLVLSNVAGVPALQHARRHGVPCEVISHRGWGSRDDFERALVGRLQAVGAQYVVLAGFMRVLGSRFVSAFPQRILNIHPSLLPAFPGMDAQAQALAQGCRISGCTVHFVDEGVDTGPIVAQAAVAVFLDDDTRERLASRILVREHRLLVTVLQWLSEGRVHVSSKSGRRPAVRVDSACCWFGLEDEQ